MRESIKILFSIIVISNLFICCDKRIKFIPYNKEHSIVITQDSNHIMIDVYNRKGERKDKYELLREHGKYYLVKGKHRDLFMSNGEKDTYGVSESSSRYPKATISIMRRNKNIIRTSLGFKDSVHYYKFLRLYYDNHYNIKFIDIRNSTPLLAIPNSYTSTSLPTNPLKEKDFIEE